VSEIRRHELELTGTLIEELQSIPGLRVIGPASLEKRVGIVSFTMEGFAPSDIANILDRQYGIATRAGLHCSPSAHSTIGTLKSGTVRASLSHLSKEEEVSQLSSALKEIRFSVKSN
ncbi:MAG: aminotransferase class V-fold PLP-dependent enzyme, partial [Actinomycetota bacterium]|nr:aminotransferase class V-fold PLP-dependent enzyme [Actinomycetota bacterium]